MYVGGYYGDGHKQVESLASLAQLPPWSSRTNGPKPELHMWVCDDSRRDQENGVHGTQRHDTIRFIWDGVRDLADPGAMARAALFDALQSGTFVCRCGCRGIFRSENLIPDQTGYTGPPAVSGSLDPGIYGAMLMTMQQLLAMQQPLLTAVELQVLRKRLGLISATPPEEQGADTMTTKTGTENSVIRKVGAEASDAAWRTAAKQFLRLAKDPLVAVLARNLAPGDKRARMRISKFLATDAGESMLAAMLGGALLMIPETQFGNKPARLGRELRVGAMASSADALAEVVMGPLRAVLSSGLLGDPGQAGELGDGEDRIGDVVESPRAAVGR